MLDGVPLAVKDDMDCLPHPSTGVVESCLFQYGCKLSSVEL